jgi:hypothetical protein
LSFSTGKAGATVEKTMKQKGWLGCAQENAWFDGRVGQVWIEQVLKPYIGDTDQALLLIDHFKVHLASPFVQAVNDLGVDVDYIPAGYTCVLQPVDVGVNASFKKAIRDLHHSWCMEKYPIVLAEDKLPTPERDDVYEWVIESFKRVTAESIRKTFLYIGFVDKSQYNNFAISNDEEESKEKDEETATELDDDDEEEDDDYPEEDGPIAEVVDELRRLELAKKK